MLQHDTLMKSVASKKSESSKESTYDNVDDKFVQEPDLPASKEINYMDNDSRFIEAKVNSNHDDVNDEDKHVASDDDLLLANIEGNGTAEMEGVGENLDNTLSSNVDSYETETKDLSFPESSSEYLPSKPQNTSDRENNHDINSENRYVPSPSQSSWGSKIRSMLAREPGCKPYVPPQNLSKNGSHSNTPCRVDVSKNVDSDNSTKISPSLKRKTFEIDCTMSCSKKQKINGTQNSTFFSMVSSPLWLLKNKISDHIMNSPKVNQEENIKDNIEEEHEECKIAEGSGIKDKNVLTSGSTNINSNLTNCLCIVM